MTLNEGSSSVRLLSEHLQRPIIMQLPVVWIPAAARCTGDDCVWHVKC